MCIFKNKGGEKEKKGSKCLILETVNGSKPKTNTLCCKKEFLLKNMQSVFGIFD